eukprot:6190677-Pleurochrysis_carterae.AAC.1
MPNLPALLLTATALAATAQDVEEETFVEEIIESKATPIIILLAAVILIVVLGFRDAYRKGSAKFRKKL